jgi:hypothetical protein
MSWFFLLQWILYYPKQTVPVFSRITDQSDNAEIHRKANLGKFMNQSVRFPGSSTKLLDQQEQNV